MKSKEQAIFNVDGTQYLKIKMSVFTWVFFEINFEKYWGLVGALESKIFSGYFIIIK